MSTFNAGAIEARLTLDRSDFTSELRQARAQADAFERDRIKLDVSIGGIADDIAMIQSQLQALSDQTVHIYVSADGGNITYLQQRLDSLRNATVYIRVDVDDYKIDLLQQQLANLDDKTVHVDVKFGGMAAEIARLQAILERYDHSVLNIDLKINGLASEVARLQAMLERYDHSVLNIDLKINGLSAEIAKLQAELERYDHFALNIDVKIGGLGSEVARLQAFLERYDHAVLNIDVKLNGLASSAARLQAFLERYDHFSINIDVDTVGAHIQLGLLGRHIQSLDDTVRVSALGSGSNAGGGGGRGGMIMLVLKILLALAPLVVVAIAGIVAAVVALGAALAGAAGGVGILVAGFVGVIKRYNELSDAAKNAAGPIGDFTRQLQAVKDAYSSFIDNIQTDAFKTMAAGMYVLSLAMPALHGLFHAFNGVLQEALGAVAAFVLSPEFDRMVDFFMTTGVQAFEGFLAIGGNLLLFFGRLFEAFGPLAVSMVDGLARITAGWAEWADGLAQTEGFKSFIDYVSVNGPLLLDTLGSIGSAFITIGEALAPLAGPMMTVIKGIADFIAGTDPAIIGAIASGLAAIAITMKLVSTAMAIVNAVMAANPFVLIGLLIVGLVAAFMYLWKTNEGFRDAMKAVWERITTNWNNLMDVFKKGGEIIKAVWDKIVAGAEWVYDVLLGHSIIPDIVNGVIKWFKDLAAWIVAPIKAAWDAIVNAWNAIKEFTVKTFQAVKDFLSTTWDSIKGKTTETWTAIKTAFSDAWTNIKEGVRAAWEAIKGFFTTGWSAVKGGVSAAWESIKGIFSAGWSNLTGNVSRAWSTIRGYFDGAWSAIKGQVSSAWGAIKTAFSGGIGGVVSLVASLPGKAVSALASLGGVITGVARSAWTSFKGAVSTGIEGAMGLVRAIPGKITSVFGNFGSLLTGAGSRLMEGLAAGVRSAGAKVVEAARKIVQSVKNLLPGSPIKEGPLKSWNRGGAGVRLMDMLATGIDKGGSSVKSAMASQLADVADIAGMKMGGVGFVNGRLGIDSPNAPVTPQVSVQTAAPDLSALIAENRAMREAMDRMVAEYGKMVDNQLILARQGAI